MSDPAIDAFFAERKENWLKTRQKASMSDAEIQAVTQECELRFSPAEWLPDAAKRAGQISLSTHPCTFSHPSSRKNKNGSVNAVVAEAQRRNDGYLRSGNVYAETDALGNAAALDVYKFLTLEMADKQSLLAHIQQETELAKVLLDEAGDKQRYQECRDGFLQMAAGTDEPVTSSRIKQVYFWVGEDEYHLLSPLTPSGLVFELRRRIDALRFSDEQKALRELKRHNKFSEQPLREIYGITTIGFGGTKPQNISVLNNQNAGKAHLLLSLPPQLSQREIRIPKTNFFSDTLNPWQLRETVDVFHRLLKLPAEKKDHTFRDKRDNRIQDYLDNVIMVMWTLRRELETSDIPLPQNLPAHQRIWLLPDNRDARNQSDDWLDKVIADAARYFVACYKKFAGKKAITLSDTELSAIKDTISRNKEMLR